MAPGRCSTQARQRLASITPGATIAPVGQASRHREHVPQPSAATPVATGSDAVVTTQPSTNQLPAPDTQQVGVLAEPAEPGAVGDLAIDDRVVVGEGDGAVVGGPQPTGHRPQPGPQRGVVVDPGVAGDARLDAGGSSAARRR